MTLWSTTGPRLHSTPSNCELVSGSAAHWVLARPGGTVCFVVRCRCAVGMVALVAGASPAALERSTVPCSPPVSAIAAVTTRKSRALSSSTATTCCWTSRATAIQWCGPGVTLAARPRAVVLPSWDGSGGCRRSWRRWLLPGRSTVVAVRRRDRRCPSLRGPHRRGRRLQPQQPARSARCAGVIPRGLG